MAGGAWAGRCSASTATAPFPTDNPFFGTAGALPRIWASAFATRSPSRSARHQPQIFINDVGQTTWEEINDGEGRNYGWPETEGPTSRPATSRRRSSRTPTPAVARGDRRRVLQSPLNRSSRPTTPATTSSATFAAAGSDARARRGNTSPTSLPASPRVDLKVTDDGACTTSRADRDARTGVGDRVDYGARRARHHDPALAGFRLLGRRSPSASRVGAGPLTLPWRRNGSNIAGATAQEATRLPRPPRRITARASA